MKFYDVLSRYYDVIFPVSNEKVKFLEKHLQEGHILDVACGSGEYSIELNKLGYNITAVDLDKEMIEKLKAKKNTSDSFQYKVMNMKDIDNLNEKYDGLFCIGNSLVHLDNNDEIKEFLKKSYNVLNENGVFICQIINYDRILNNNIKSLPTIDRPEQGIKFIREYSMKGNKVQFKGIIESANEGKFENTVELYPLKSDEFVEDLKEAGFNSIQLFGNYKEEDYSYDSFFTIVVAR